MVLTADGSVRLENERASILLSPEGTVLRFTDLADGAELLASPGEPFCSVKAENGEERLPDRLEAEGDLLTFGFGADKIVIRAAENDDFFRFTVIRGPETEYHSFRFARFRFGYDFSMAGGTVVSGYPMSMNVNPAYYPGGAAKAVVGECFSKIGAEGADLVVAVSPWAEQRIIARDKIYPLIPRGALPVTLTGGANAPDCRATRGDYVIVSDSDPALIPGYIDFYTRWNVDQLDFHQGTGTFRQGDFYFHRNGDAAGFKKQVAEPLGKAGITCGLHTYSFYIDYHSPLLAEPRWQKDLEVMGRYTLKQAVGAEDGEIFVRESTADVSRDYSFCSHNSQFLLIDGEIIRFTSLHEPHGEHGFGGCTRGWAGTKPVPHAEGAEVKHLGGYYFHLAPEPCSELFYHIARETAKAYNEGGFGMIYFDALDGIGVHAAFRGEADLSWYYALAFVNEVVKNCVRSPIVEYSMLPPSLWIARGRGGAWDTPNRAYKHWADLHLASNLELRSCFYNATFGWSVLYPDAENRPGNFDVRYLFTDDVDYMGTLALIHDQSIVYNGFRESQLEAYPALRRNMERYLRYNILRKEKAVPEAVLDELRRGKHEWKLSENGRSFSEVCYSAAKVRSSGAADLHRIAGNNPFGEQEPFVRIECMLSSSGEDPAVLLPLDPDRPLRGQKLSVHTEPRDMGDRRALRVKILGNGSADAVCIRIKGRDNVNSGAYDFVARLNYTGWREFLFAEPENGTFPDLVFPEKPDPLYACFRECVCYERLSDAEVFLSGSCEGVRMGNIEAVRPVRRPLVNPAIRGENGGVLVFDCILDPGEYLEYEPGCEPDGRAVIYDRYGHERPVGMVRGSLRLPAGDYTAYLSDEGTADAPGIARLTFGFGGRAVMWE